MYILYGMHSKNNSSSTLLNPMTLKKIRFPFLNTYVGLPLHTYQYTTLNINIFNYLQ